MADDLRALPGVGVVDRLLANSIGWLVAIAVVAALQIWLIFTHKPWLDEWQALQIAVQSPSLSDLLANLRYEGHPAPWYLLLRGLAAVLPDPLLALPVAALLMAVVVQSLVLFAAPFSRFERLLVALSQFVLFEFLTLSRSLTMGVALVLLATALWHRRRAVWLAIAFLPQCDFLFGVLAIGLCFLRWREKRLWWPGVALLAASGLIAGWTVHPAPDIRPALQAAPLANGIGLWIARVATIGFPLQWNGGALQWNSAAPVLLLPVGGVLFYAVVKAEIVPYRDHAIAFFGFVAITFGFSIAIYPLAPRHLFMIALLLIALVWLRRGQGLRSGRLFQMWLAIAAICGLTSVMVAAAKPFDTADLAAAEIRARGLVHKQWFAFRDSRGQGVAAINGMVFQPVGRDCVEDFMRWNFSADYSAEEVSSILDQYARAHGRYYILSDVPLERHVPFAQRFAAYPAGYDGFRFYLYVVAPDRADAVPTAKRCNGPVRPLRGG
ncbi:MAG: hypothetical protein JSR96_14880 [Proteobacteria bacterium]|nr:hypothetical protein [Pseudomonadota bacterium]